MSDHTRSMALVRLKKAQNNLSEIRAKVEHAFVQGWGNPYAKQNIEATNELIAACEEATKELRNNPY